MDEIKELRLRANELRRESEFYVSYEDSPKEEERLHNEADKLDEKADKMEANMLHQCKGCGRKVTKVDLDENEKCPICVRSSRMNDDFAIMNTTLISSLKIIEAQKDHIRRLEERISLFPEISLKTSI